MEEIIDLKNVNDYCKPLKLSSLHPLVTVLDLSKGEWPKNPDPKSVRYHFYGVFLKDGEECELRYGRKNYDFQEGTLVFVGPEQVVNISKIGKRPKISGYALLFHPELLLGTHLVKKIGDYNFFSYETSEALHISPKERQIVLDCFQKIEDELAERIDKHSKTVILSAIELFLNYCQRFYDRQFITRDSVNRNVVEQFGSALQTYIWSGMAKENGIPSVAYFAGKLNLSPNYFGDLVKKQTGKSAQEFIQLKLMEIAKQRIYDPELSIAEIAYGLGFRYPQHFSRLFKQQVGLSPKEFRQSLN
ncbi:helix-turn-helix domain-containing protein [Algoriphagus sediminis]|uniref:Helix-turn-helix domain-containing protein n=1 Tax=Algoriphagus sediminis TaxID=3057113 RepID=A0ABT7Y864_9BACT|nr:helix-turn-helix domain-containing protein [Algoriphagus sediminis]MDN3202699.1 helix-turn-helix domain-containing protein [Algoriphagus sediminis]